MTPADKIPIDAKAVTMGQWLKGQELRIPDFQRPYKWGEDQIKDFWDDILDAATRNTTHFFGTLLTAPAEHPAEGNRLDILDGQQRLTTFTLLLIALDREFENLDVDGASKGVREGSQKNRERIRGALRLPQDDQRRLRLRSGDDHLLGSIMAGNPGDGSVGSAFTRLVNHLTTHLGALEDRYGEADRILSAVLDASVVIHAHCLAGFDPFVVFSTLNATGLPLTATQILRARSLGLVHALSEMVRNETSQAWEGVEKLGDDDGDRFLAATLVLRTGERIQTKDVVRRFDHTILKTKDLPSDSTAREDHFLAVAREIHKLVPIYRDLADGKWPQGASAPPSDWHAARVKFLVKNLGVKQILPLLVAAAATSPTKLWAVLDSVERAAFVALVCLDNQTRWGDTAFKLAKRVYHDGLSENELVESLHEFFTEQLTAPEQVFARRLPELLRYNGRRKTQIRYFLTTVNDWGFPATSPTAEPDKQAVWNLGDIHVDHICPQKGFAAVAEADRDRIGNLTPLKGGDNSGLSNKPFEEKKDVYDKSPLRITKTLKSLELWDQDALEEREARLVEFATKLFCRDLQV